MLQHQALPVGEDLEYLIWFLGLTHGRTPTMRNLLRDYREGRIGRRLRIAARSPELLARHYQLPAGDPRRMRPDEIQGLANEERPFELTDDSLNAIAARMAMAGMNEQVRQLLHLETWSLVFAASEAPDFILGDTPLTIWFTGPFARKARADRVPSALIYLNTEVVLPVSPRAAPVGRVDQPSQVGQVSAHDVTIVNSRPVHFAHRVLYSSRPDFVFWDV